MSEVLLFYLLFYKLIRFLNILAPNTPQLLQLAQVGVVFFNSWPTLLKEFIYFLLHSLQGLFTPVHVQHHFFTHVQLAHIPPHFLFHNLHVVHKICQVLPNLPVQGLVYSDQRF